MFSPYSPRSGIFFKRFSPVSQSSRTKGFSLVEIMLVLGVIAILAIASFLVYDQVSHKAKIKDTQDQVRAISAGVRSIFPMGNYGSLNNQVAFSAKIIPEKYRREPGNPAVTAMTHPWGGQMAVSGTDKTTATVDCNTITCSRFRIVMTSVPSRACIDLLTTVGGEFEVTWAIHAGNGMGADNPNMNDPGGRPNVARIIDACRDAELVNIRFVGT